MVLCCSNGGSTQYYLLISKFNQSDVMQSQLSVMISQNVILIMGCMFYEQEKWKFIKFAIKINQTLIKNRIFAKLNKFANNKLFHQITSSQAVWRRRLMAEIVSIHVLEKWQQNKFNSQPRRSGQVSLVCFAGGVKQNRGSSPLRWHLIRLRFLAVINWGGLHARTL